jgi:hypothetical protein
MSMDITRANFQREVRRAHKKRAAQKKRPVATESCFQFVAPAGTAGCAKMACSNASPDLCA